MSDALAARLDLGRRVAREAGALLLTHFRRLEGYDKKGRFDLVTRADRESEALIRDALRAAFPSDLRIEEEADGKAGAARRRDEIEAAPFAWCVDPLDGTTSFVHGYPNFAVALGLLHFGRPALGVVFAPYFEELYTGGTGIPATLDDRPIHVSATAHLEDALIGTGFPYNRVEHIDRIVGQLRSVLLKARDVRRGGAAALDQCHLAAGALDGFYEIDLSPWDLAGPQAILLAAGGRVSGFDGEPHDLFAGRTVASNGKIHDALLETLRG